MRFGKRGKLSLRHIGPLEILGRGGEVAYRIVLPPQLSNIHNVFHVSMLRRYIKDPTHILDYPQIELREDLSTPEAPMQILDRREQVLRNKNIPLVLV